MSEELQKNPSSQEEEIDLLKLALKIWRERQYILKTFRYAVLIGLVIVFSIPREYTAEAMIAPEMSDNNGGGLSALAAMAGLNLNATSGADAIYPDLYPDIVTSTPFITGLFYVRVKDLDGEIDTTLYCYLNDYQRMPWWSLITSAPFKAVGWAISLLTDEDDDDGILCLVFFFFQVGTVGDHNTHAKAQGEKRLSQCRKHGAEGDLAPVGDQHIGKSLGGAGHGKRTHQQNDQNDEQGGHPELIKPFDAVLDALDDDIAGGRHKNRTENDGSQREPCFAGGRIIAKQPVEIPQRVRIDFSRLGGIARHITQHPAAHMGIVAGDDKRHNHADPADPLKAGVPQLFKAVYGIGLRGTADGQLREHDGDTDEQNDGKIDKNVCTAAALKGLSGELPDVSESDSRPCRR